MTTQQIEYVMMLAEEKSFSAAAKKLFITQPSLSQFIMNLENQLGTQLFDRNSYPIKLTPAGEVYIKNARRILDIEREMDAELTDLMEMKTGSLVVGADSFRAACLLSQSIAAFHKKYDNIKVDVMEAEKEELNSMILRGDLDFYIGSGTPDPKLFHKEFLSLERIYLAVPSKNPICAKLSDYALSANDITSASTKSVQVNPVSLSMFADEKFVLLGQENSISASVSRICEAYGMEPKSFTKVRNMATVFSFINSGIGVGFIPDSFIKYGNYKEHPIYYKLDETSSTDDIVLVSRKNKYLTKAAVEYVKILKQLIGYGTWM